MNKNWYIAVAVTVIIVAVGAFFYLGRNQGRETSTTPATPGTITIDNFSFNPETLTVKQGDTITWINNDRATHTVISNDGSFSSPEIASGGKYEFTPSNKGAFSYYCDIHPSMTGTFTVE